MKKCELCKSPAQTYCESDQAILCWDCDAKVHGANFLVARHSRSLLCNRCKAPTPWTASGARLGRTVSVCDGCASCVRERCVEEESEGANDGDLDTDADNDDEDEEASDYEEFEDEEEEDREEEGENQVVPWSSTPPPPAASSSSSEDDFLETPSPTMFSRKRIRDNSRDLHSPIDDCCSSSHLNNRSKSTAEAEGEGTFADSLKSRRDKGGRRLERNSSTSAVTG